MTRAVLTSDLPGYVAPPPLYFKGWVYDRRSRMVIYKESGYDVPMWNCNTSAQILDWIIQLSQKEWEAPDALLGFIRMVNYLIDIQAHLCPGGESKFLKLTELTQILDAQGSTFRGASV